MEHRVVSKTDTVSGRNKIRVLKLIVVVADG